MRYFNWYCTHLIPYVFRSFLVFLIFLFFFFYFFFLFLFSWSAPSDAREKEVRTRRSSSSTVLWRRSGWPENSECSAPLGQIRQARKGHSEPSGGSALASSEWRPVRIIMTSPLLFFFNSCKHHVLTYDNSQHFMKFQHIFINITAKNVECYPIWFENRTLCKTKKKKLMICSWNSIVRAVHTCATLVELEQKAERQSHFHSFMTIFD